MMMIIILIIIVIIIIIDNLTSYFLSYSCDIFTCLCFDLEYSGLSHTQMTVKCTSITGQLSKEHKQK